MPPGVEKQRSRFSTGWTLLSVFLLTSALCLPAGRALMLERWVGPPDFIVSLASHEWERLPETASIAERYPLATVVLTQPSVVTEKNCHACEHRVDWLASAGVPPHQILVIPLTLGGTYGEAVAVKKLVGIASEQKILVVTSPYHTRRALAVFRSVLGPKLDVGVQGASKGLVVHPRAWWLFGYDRWYVTYEWAASVYYRYQYGVPLLAG